VTRVESLPYLVPAPERVRAGAWQLAARGEMKDLPEILLHWDPNTPVAVSRHLEVDLAGLLTDCDLASATVRAVLAWHCPGTMLRGTSTLHTLATPDGTASLTVAIQGQDLAQSVILETQLVLCEGNPRSALAPHHLGAVLWRDTHELTLEGIGTRFPVELCDFGGRSWLPEGAAFYLDWDPGDLEQPVMGRVRLLVNTKNDSVREAVESCSAVGTESPSTRPILSAIYHDVGRVMIMGALANDDFVARAAQYPEGSVGRIIWRLLKSVIPNLDLEAASAQSRKEPFLFECKLQEHLQLFSRSG